MWLDGCSQGYPVPQKTWTWAQINKSVLGKGMGHKWPPIGMWFFFQWVFVTLCSRFAFQQSKASWKQVQNQRRDYPPIRVLCDMKHLSRGKTEHKFISLSTRRIFFVLYGTNEGTPLSFSGGTIGGGRGRCWVAVQKEGSKAWEGWEGAFLLQVTGHEEGECRSGEVALPGSLHVLCLTKLPSEGNSELSWHCVQEEPGKTRFKRASGKTFLPLTTPPSEIYSVLDFHFPLMPFRFYFITA